jgi:hypothetical protein
MARDWQLMFISVPVIFLIEMLFATWSWQDIDQVAADERQKEEPGHRAGVMAAARQAAQLLPDAPPPLRPPGGLVLLFVVRQQPPGLYLGGCQLLLRSFCQLQVAKSISIKKMTGTLINISCQSRAISFRHLELAKAAQPDAPPPLRPPGGLVLLFVVRQQPPFQSKR